jgi:hypothetical protein
MGPRISRWVLDFWKICVVTFKNKKEAINQNKIKNSKAIKLK